jgi:hypothetical protein
VRLSNFEGKKVKAITHVEAMRLLIEFSDGTKIDVWGCGCCGSPSVDVVSRTGARRTVEGEEYDPSKPNHLRKT